jgi:hypothetical protein
VRGSDDPERPGQRAIQWWTGQVLELRCCLSSAEATVALGNNIKEVCVLKSKETSAEQLNSSAIAAAAASLSHQVTPHRMPDARPAHAMRLLEQVTLRDLRPRQLITLPHHGLQLPKHGQLPAAQGSSTTVSRSDIRLIQHLDSSAHGLVRRWSLIGHFPILYYPRHDAGEHHHAHAAARHAGPQDAGPRGTGGTLARAHGGAAAQQTVASEEPPRPRQPLHAQGHQVTSFPSQSTFICHQRRGEVVWSPSNASS